MQFALSLTSVAGTSQWARQRNNAEESARFQLQTLQIRPGDVNGVAKAVGARHACPRQTRYTAGARHAVPLPYGVKIEESARRNTYSAVTHCATGWPAFVAGLNSILQAARIAFSVSPAGSPFTTLIRPTFARADSKTFRTTKPCTPRRRASFV